jgi:hypothetical protein
MRDHSQRIAGIDTVIKNKLRMEALIIEHSSEEHGSGPNSAGVSFVLLDPSLLLV